MNTGIININARFLTQPITGVQRYAFELVKTIDGMVNSGEIDSTQYSFSLIAPQEADIDMELKHIPLRKVGRLSGHAWEQFELPSYIKEGLLISLCNAAPMFKRNQAVTIHDASIFANPANYPPAFRTWYKALLKGITRNAKAIITDSQFSKSELVRFCEMDESKVKVVYLGKEHILSIAPDESIIHKHRLGDKPFVLAVSSMSPNKNFRAIVKAIELLGDVDYDIVIAGGTNPRIFSRSDLPASTKYLGYISDGELRALYERAACFVYPSFYEGFGLPPLEAMACGTPVITSNTSSLPEVVGDAGIMVDPNNVEELAEAMCKVLADNDLRRNMREKGLQRAKLFTWENTARQTLKVYKEAFNG